VISETPRAISPIFGTMRQFRAVAPTPNSRSTLAAGLVGRVQVKHIVDQLNLLAARCESIQGDIVWFVWRSRQKTGATCLGVPRLEEKGSEQWHVETPPFQAKERGH